MIDLVGAAPDRAEAALMQAYPGRDPLGEVLRGDITLRTFRAMFEGLPAGNVFQRAVQGPWVSDEAMLLLATESRIRDLIGMLMNMFRPKGSGTKDVPYLEVPPSEVELAERAERSVVNQVEQDELRELGFI